MNEELSGFNSSLSLSLSRCCGISYVPLLLTYGSLLYGSSLCKVMHAAHSDYGVGEEFVSGCDLLASSLSHKIFGFSKLTKISATIPEEVSDTFKRTWKQNILPFANKVSCYCSRDKIDWKSTTSQIPINEQDRAMYLRS